VCLYIYIRYSNGNIHRRTGHEDTEVEQKYSSTLSLISGLDAGEW